MKFKRIAFVMPWHISERGGGAEVQANYLAVELAKRAYKIHYICQTNTRSKENMHEVLDGLHIHWLKPSGRFPWIDQQKYKKALEISSPDIVVQRLSNNVTYIIGQYRLKHNCKFIWICTDDLSPLKSFHLTKYKQKFNLGNTPLIKYLIFYLNSRIMDYYRNQGMKNIDLAFTQNKIQSDLLKETFGYHSKRMISGHPLVKPTLNVSERFQKKIVLWCANLGKHKRPELFIELARQMQEYSYLFIMVGGHSNKNYMNRLLQNKPNNLITTGHLSFDEALGYFDDATLLVNTSSSEGFSNTFIQAWLRGTPTIVFGADPDDMIETYGLGKNVSNSLLAQEFILKLLTNERLYISYSMRVQKFAEKNHNMKTMTDQFLGCLKEPNQVLSFNN